MKRVVPIISIGTLYGIAASPSFAGTGIFEDRCCLIFLFFGALIVIAQLIPAVLLIIGFIKGFPIKHPGPRKGEDIGKRSG